MTTFEDRADAGRQLAGRLRGFERPILLGLARGGVPVASSASEVLGCDFDALVVRKIKAAGEDREFGDGAVAPDGIEVGDAPREEVARAAHEMDRRIDAYLDGHPAPDIAGRLAVLVDDGLATGVTAIAAARYARTLGPARLVLAVPVLSEEALRAMEPEVDEVVYVEMPVPFHAVGDSYEKFPEVTDDEVKMALAKPL